LDGLEDLPADLRLSKTNSNQDLNHKMGHPLNNNNFNPDLSLSSMPDLNLDHSLGLSRPKGSQNNPGDQLCNLNNKLSSLNLQLLCY